MNGFLLLRCFLLLWVLCTHTHVYLAIAFRSFFSSWFSYIFLYGKHTQHTHHLPPGYDILALVMHGKNHWKWIAELSGMLHVHICSQNQPSRKCFCPPSFSRCATQWQLNGMQLLDVPNPFWISHCSTFHLLPCKYFFIFCFLFFLRLCRSRRNCCAWCRIPDLCIKMCIFVGKQ